MALMLPVTEYWTKNHIMLKHSVTHMSQPRENMRIYLMETIQI
jgi:hypothetical protein